MNMVISQRKALLATIPFGIFGIAWVASNSGLDALSSFQSVLFAMSILVMFIFLGIGWMNNFPVWSFPAIGFCLFISLFFMFVTIPAFKSEPLGYWALLPLLVTSVISLLFNTKLEPVKQLINKTKKDPALILFALYGFVPFFIFLFYDEMHSVWLIPGILFSIFVLSLGLYTFLRSAGKKIRIFSIISSGLIALIIAFVANFFY